MLKRGELPMGILLEHVALGACQTGPVSMKGVAE